MLSLERAVINSSIDNVSGYIMRAIYTTSPLFELLANSGNIFPDNVLPNSNVLGDVSVSVQLSLNNILSINVS